MLLGGNGAAAVAGAGAGAGAAAVVAGAGAGAGGSGAAVVAGAGAGAGGGGGDSGAAVVAGAGAGAAGVGFSTSERVLRGCSCARVRNAPSAAVLRRVEGPSERSAVRGKWCSTGRGDGDAAALGARGAEDIGAAEACSGIACGPGCAGRGGRQR